MMGKNKCERAHKISVYRVLLSFNLLQRHQIFWGGKDYHNIFQDFSYLNKYNLF